MRHSNAIVQIRSYNVPCLSSITWCKYKEGEEKLASEIRSTGAARKEQMVIKLGVYYGCSLPLGNP